MTRSRRSEEQELVTTRGRSEGLPKQESTQPTRWWCGLVPGEAHRRGDLEVRGGAAKGRSGGSEWSWTMTAFGCNDLRKAGGCTPTNRALLLEISSILSVLPGAGPTDTVPRMNRWRGICRPSDSPRSTRKSVLHRAGAEGDTA